MKLFLSGGEHRHWRHPEGRCRQPIPQSIHAGGCRCLSDKILLDWVSFFFFFFSFFFSFLSFFFSFSDARSGFVFCCCCCCCFCLFCFVGFLLLYLYRNDLSPEDVVRFGFLKDVQN